MEREAMANDRRPGNGGSELAALIDRHAAREGLQATAVPSLYLYRSVTAAEPIHAIYEPSICIVAQGAKAVTLGGRSWRYDPERFLVVSVSLPVTSRILEASPERPHLALHVSLDPAMIASVLTEMQAAPPSGPRLPGSPAPRSPLAVAALDPLLRDAVSRLVRLLDAPRHIPVLAPLIMREITYLALIGDEGARLREIALSTNQAARVARAVEWLLREYDRPLRIAELAERVGMSVSGFHHHFKAVTAMSPLQFQKQVRLQQARRLMLGEDVDATGASIRVGYESPSQFRREYRRLFGAPPGRDIARLRSGGAEPW